MDVHTIMAALSRQRPVFHSEADFQHELAMALREAMPTCSVRLERPFGYHKGGATDIVVMNEGTTFGIELKYLTRRLDCEVSGEVFQLKAQGGTVLRRYDVLKDVARLEEFNAAYGGKSYMLALTNDPAYWRKTSRGDTIDAQFRLCEGRSVAGHLAWGPHASDGSTKGRTTPIELRDVYQVGWRDYSTFPEQSSEFRYLCFEIGLLATP